MATEFLKISKDCCTCQFWTGERKLNAGKNVIVTSGGIKGLCTKKKREFLANYSSCPNFVKWDKLP